MFEMMMPTLNAAKPEAAIREMQNYLFQLRQQLGMALEQIQKGVTTGQEETAQALEKIQAAQKPSATFSQVKGLIIKSADIVEAYSEKFKAEYDGRYVAQSDFGTYREETAHKLEITAENLTQAFKDVQEIQSAVDEIQSSVVDMTAYVRTGKLYEEPDGTARYGVEIGEKAVKDGVLAFRKFARMISDRMSFFDENENEVAYISDRKLYVSGAEMRSVAADSVTARKWAMIGSYVITAGSDGHLSIV